MRRILIATFALLWGLAGAATAQQAAPAHAPVVVELYTSQGCSSCPPADELLGRLAKHPGVIALGFHVDYWDYIGWKDEFGSAEYTARQKDYARAVNSRTVYTPQMIVDGVSRVVGFRPNEVSTLIQKYQAMPDPAAVQVSREGGTLKIHAEASKPFAAPALVQLVRYIPVRRIAIKRGENAGRTLDYHNIVSQLTQVGTWDGAAPFEATVEIKGDSPAVVLIQAPGPGQIYGAAQAK